MVCQIKGEIMRKGETTSGTERDENECPECGAGGIENPILDDWYECNNCVISFNADGEVEHERF